jgi:hypothetical protein
VEHDAYTDASTAPVDWWEGLDKVVKNVLMTAGALELMVDDICGFGKRIQKHHALAQTMVAADETHDQAIIDLDFGFGEYGESARYIMEWNEAIFQIQH